MTEDAPPEPFNRWVTDPMGKPYLIIFNPGGVSGPVFLGVDGDHPVVSRVLGIVNSVLVRVQRPKSGESVQVTVLDPDRDGGTVVYACLESSLMKGRARAISVAEEIQAGTFVPNDYS